uniref:Uncharacterized protein n=1 Tax=Caenorhabditis japonica TaxID=281687 RepID=A0A8R1DZ12_CAEJA
MAYCSANDSFTLLDSPEFFSTVLHTMGCLSIPVYVFGGYCILAKTPGDMHTVKFSLFNFHIWSCFVDIVLSLLTTPYMLGPLFAGIPLGILSLVGMDTAPQVYLVMAAEAGRLSSHLEQLAILVKYAPKLI